MSTPAAGKKSIDNTLFIPSFVQMPNYALVFPTHGKWIGAVMEAALWVICVSDGEQESRVYTSAVFLQKDLSFV